MTSRIKKNLVVIVLLVIAFWILFLDRVGIENFVFELGKGNLPQKTRIVTTQKPSLSQTSQIKASEINLAVPFSPQAPFADWSLPYEEACEEISAILVNKYYKNQNITPEIANQEILKLVAWEKKRFGYYEHTTVAETAVILKEYFGYKKVSIIYNFTIKDIEDQLLAGRPIIVPVDGELVGNPYYRQPGPAYHMMIIKGFTADGKFITNDVGTRRGYNYTYNESILYSAIHDAPTGGDNWSVLDPEAYVRTGQKAIIVVYPN